MKVEIIWRQYTHELEDAINQFLDNSRINIISIGYSSHHDGFESRYSALIAYERKT